MPDNPLVTFAIPSYNSAQYLPDAISSVYRQGISDYEILIFDNASDDNTEEVVQSFKDERLRYFRNDRNVGSCANGNLCMQHARGKYLKYLCADDVFLDGTVAKMLAVLENSPQVVLVTCDMMITDESLNHDRPVRMFPGRHSGERVINACLSGLRNYVGGPSNIMYRMSDIEGIWMDCSYKYIVDLKMCCELMRRGSYVNIDEIGYLYRRHEATETEVNCPPPIRVTEYLRLVDEIGQWNALSCLQAIRGGLPESRFAAKRNIVGAFAPARIWAAVIALPDVLRMKLRAELPNL